MPAPFFPNSWAFSQAGDLQTLLALSVIKLFKEGFVPSPTTVVADLDAEEADYDDYILQTITAWLAPGSSPFGGAQITAPTEQFTCTADQVVPNAIGGYWIELAAGDVVLIRQFDTPVAMVTAGDFVQVTPTIVIPNGT